MLISVCVGRYNIICNHDDSWTPFSQHILCRIWDQSTAKLHLFYKNQNEMKISRIYENENYFQNHYCLLIQFILKIYQ